MIGLGDYRFSVDSEGVGHRVTIERGALEAISINPEGIPSATLYWRHRLDIKRMAVGVIKDLEVRPQPDGSFRLTAAWLDQ